MADDMKAAVGALLKGIDRYNPKNLVMFEQYVDRQCAENMYDLEANLAVLKLYQFNPSEYNPAITQRILLKAITNLPHTDIILCKCLLAPENMEEPEVQDILRLSTLLELCQFQAFWEIIVEQPSIIAGMTGFEDSIRRYACHVLNITYQRISKELVRSTLNVTGEDARRPSLCLSARVAYTQETYAHWIYAQETYAHETYAHETYAHEAYAQEAYVYWTYAHEKYSQEAYAHYTHA
ncbi:eukaryotic translation initiation factor 3 subunit K-like [Pollicipes pollicipes]|uniref:eukaryotic translation initiation factor 3 subunit K-like n=1 Tax=Pollicipes pollicipes TaxID=41117 RepID=UPI0018853110|nr:eukaryotic translation initiation factor 3 subunit K-like [Pollicipes pollicipes]